MSMPVKLSDELVEQAREEAKAADRSVPSQIEHWARLGRSVESALRHEDVLALKRANGDIDAALPTPEGRRAVLAALRDLAASSSRPDVATGRTVYQDDGTGLIERIEANGHRSVGHLVDRRFVPDTRRRRTRGK